MKNLCDLLSAVYVGALLVIFGSGHTGRELFPTVALLTTFSAFLFLPLLFLIIWTIINRSMISISCAIIWIALFLFLHPITPQNGLFSSETDTSSFEAMTFNIGLNITPADKVTAVLSKQTVDFIGVQEATEEHINSFDANLGDQYPYQLFDPKGYGVGLLSQRPIINHEWLQPPTAGRPFLRAELDVDGQIVHLFVTHISQPQFNFRNGETYGIPVGINEYWQAQESYFVQEIAQKVDGPVLIMGDFNMSEKSYRYEEMAVAFGDAFRDSSWGFGFTFPNFRMIYGRPFETPILRIDYIFYGGDLAVQTSEVVCLQEVSDHCAVQAEFVLPNGQ